MDDGRRRRRKGVVPRLPTAVAVRPGRCADAGRRRRVGRHLHPRGRARPSVRAQTAAVAGGAERIPGTEDWVGRISPISGVAVVMINSRASAGDFAATRSFDYTFGVRLPGPRRDVYVQTTVDRRDRRTGTDHRSGVADEVHLALVEVRGRAGCQLQSGHGVPYSGQLEFWMTSTKSIRRKPGTKCSSTSAFTVPNVLSGRCLNPSVNA